MNRTIIFFFLAGSILLSSCANEQKTTTAETSQSVVLPDGFLDFLDEFHSDINYQKAHIQWPLEGVPSMIDSSYVKGEFRWSQDDWVMHNDFDEDNEEFEQKFTLFGENMIIEHITHINGSIGMERRFSREEDSWKLIYYAGINFIE